MDIETLIEKSLAENVDFNALVKWIDTNQIDVDYAELIDAYDARFDLENTIDQFDWTVFKKHQVEHRLLISKAFNFYNQMPWVNNYSFSLDTESFVHYLKESTNKLWFDDLDSIDTKKLGNTRLKILYKVWESQAAAYGLTDDEDLRIARNFLTRHSGSVGADTKLLRTLFLEAYHEKGPVITNYYLSEFTYAVVNSSEWREHVDPMEIIENAQYTPCSSLLRGYLNIDSEPVKELAVAAFMKIIELNPGLHTFRNLCEWIGTASTDEPNKTAITEYALFFALMYLECDNKPLNTTQLKEMNLVFPGFNTSSGREKLKSAYFPDFDNYKPLVGIMQMHELLKFKFESSKTLVFDAESLEGISLG